MASTASPCARCGRTLADDVRFCPYCGFPRDAPTNTDLARHARLSAAAPRELVDKARSAVLAGERRPVTALFADVVGSTSILENVDPEDFTEVLDDAIDAMSRAVYRYEGTVARLMGDGLLAFFGAPIAHEDDPERAIRAGLDAIAEVAEVAERTELDLQIRVGINTGPVVVGDVGSELHYEYTAIGDAVNVAARMQGEARPGTVAVTDATLRLTGGRFDVHDLGLLRLKGKREAVRGFEVVGERETPPPSRGLVGMRAPLIGRDDERAALEDALTVLKNGSRGAVLVVGEPGIGKSRLLEELRPAGAANTDAPVWIDGQCLSYGRSLPYHLLLSLLRSVLGVPEADPDVAAIALHTRLAALVGDDADAVGGPIAHLLTLPLDDQERAAIERLDPRARHDRYLEAVRAVLAAVTVRAPLVIVCEDVHWADASSADALADLAGGLERTLVVCTARPDVDTPGWGLLERLESTYGTACRRLELSPLSDDDSRSLVTVLLDVDTLSAPIRSFILERSDGNPFFLEELIRMLIERGVIERRDERWVGRVDAPPVELPDTLQGLLLSRLDRLDEHARHTARVASVVGRRFDPLLLAEVVGDDVGDQLDALLDAALIEPVDDELRFRHALLQQATYDSILRRDRATLHAAVGDALERRNPGRLVELAAELAHHFEQAGDLPRARTHLIEAGEHALARFAVHEARELLDRAAALLGEDDDPRLAVRVALLRTRAGWTFVPYEVDAPVLEDALELAERIGDDRLAADLHLELVRLRLGHGETPETSPQLQTSLKASRAIAERLDDERLRALPLHADGMARYATADYRTAIELLTRAVPALEEAGDYALATEGAGSIAIAAARLGDFELADDWVARSRELGGRSGDPGAILDGDLFESIVASEYGDLDRGIDLARRGTEEARRVDNKACEVIGSYTVGEQEFRAGHAERAAEAFERSVEVAQYCGAFDVENLAAAWLAATRSDVSEAVAGLDATLEQAREMGDRLAVGHILRLRGTVRARADEPEWPTVRDDFESALVILRELGTLPAEARTLRDYAQVLDEAGDADGAADARAHADELFSRLRLRDATAV